MMHSLFRRPQHPRRGVTLVEMLVVVALLVLMMTIIVQVFQAATGSVTAAKVYQELDDELRELDATIRQDLMGVTAVMTPPIDPDDNLGYFEYIENSWADPQGEDTDDCLRFTAQSPAGQPFTGRVYLYPAQGTVNTNTAQTAAPLSQPVLITSEYAEIIYFLRNGNLYRRVLLIAPSMQNAVTWAFTQSNNLATIQNGHAPTFSTSLFGNTLNAGGTNGTDAVSWLAVNDLSAAPAPRAPGAVGSPPVLNTLGSLTNRENRAFMPRFSDDYAGPGGLTVPDGLPDDINQYPSGTYIGDGVPDYYPTLYPNLFSSQFSQTNGTNLINTAGHPLTNNVATNPPDNRLAFPYIFPGAYSMADPNAANSSNGGLGWIHVPDPSQTTAGQGAYNHAPVDVGDSLATPSSTTQYQTYWGFPTWRDTLSRNWMDPVKQLDLTMTTQSGTQCGVGAQALGLQLFSPTTNPSSTSTNLLAPASYWFNPPLFNDGAGSTSFIDGYLNPTTNSPILSAWEDDLLMTGVRSFDVKALDNSVAAYVDLGNNPLNTNTGTKACNILSLPIKDTSGAIANYNITQNGLLQVFNNQYLGPGYCQYLVSSTFSHEGLIPPRVSDYRFDPQALALGIPISVGDNLPSTIRLRRTWDSWSTEYTQAPASGFDPSTAGYPPYGLGVYPPNAGLNTSGSNTIILSNPVYPSYPPPYPAPMRGLQIQIRVVDPRNERVKVITIRQDFSDKISNPE